MKPIWLIEAGVYGPEAAPLVEEIRRQGMIADILPHRVLVKKPLPAVAGRQLSSDDCIIAYGTYPFVRHIQLHHSWVPGAWCHSEHLDCAVYYAYFGKFMLNEHYTILPGLEAIRMRDWLYSILGCDGKVFVRPTGCQKLFVGRTVEKEDFSNGLAPARYDPATKVMIARPRVVTREWRMVIADDQVIASSQYAKCGVPTFSKGCPVSVQRFTEQVLTEVGWRPDPMFMLDVCEADDRLWVMELNSFSCSWLYHCDLSEVVATAREVAEREWERKERLGERILSSVF